MTLESLAVLPEGSTLVLGSLDRLLEGIALAEGEVHGKPEGWALTLDSFVWVK
jgi:hypothetical protein